jgi:DNA-binding NtrC family response regulator
MNEKRVLIIDDEETILDTYSFLLSKEGYFVVTTTNGNKALEKLHQQPFDIVITDLTMKCKNGHTLIEDIRETFPLIPVIVLTDNLSTIVKQFTITMGVYALLEKPCSYDMLSSSIRKSIRTLAHY